MGDIRPPEPGVIPCGGFVLSPVASKFVDMCHKSGWIQWPDFDRVTWKSSMEAVQLRDDPAMLEQATPERLCRLLIVLIRQGRFVESGLGIAFDSGLLVAILRRIAALAPSPPR